MPQSHPMARVVLTRLMRDHMVTTGDRVIVGCSGGADSTCLLHMLTVSLADLQLDVIAVYVDHNLRANVRHEIEMVAKFAASVDAGFETVQIDVPGRVQQTGESRQEAARELRYQALSEIAARTKAKRIAVGHTRSDQAETVMLQLLRGAGPKGLSGIAPVYRDVIRPLIDVSRDQVETYCRNYELPYIDDPSNLHREYLRNRIRLDVMPMLAAINPGVESHLAQVADIMREEQRWLEAETDKVLSQVMIDLSHYDASQDSSKKNARILALDLAKLKDYPLGLIRRMIRAVHALVRGDEKGLTFAALDQVLESLDLEGLAHRPHHGSKELGIFGGVRVYREYDTLMFMLPGVPLAPGPIDTTQLDVPGETQVGVGRRVVARVISAGEASSESGLQSGRGHADTVRFDMDSIHLPLVIRSRRAGDRINLATGGTKKVKDLLIDAKVPKRCRDQVPIIEDQKGIIWIMGHFVASRTTISEATRTQLELSVEQIK